MKSLSAITLMELVKNTPDKTRQRAKNCKVYDIDYEIKSKHRLIVLVRCYEEYSNNSGHLVSIQFENYQPKSRDTLKPLGDDIKLHCECPAFLYWGSAYIATIGDYNLDFEEWRYPKIRDPELKNKLCKHCVKVASYLRGKTFKQLMKKGNPKLYSLYKQRRKKRTAYLTDEIVPIEDTFDAIENFIRRERPDINPDEFLRSLDRYNYETKLLEIGMVI